MDMVHHGPHVMWIWSLEHTQNRHVMWTWSLEHTQNRHVMWTWSLEHTRNGHVMWIWSLEHVYYCKTVTYNKQRGCSDHIIMTTL